MTNEEIKAAQALAEEMIDELDGEHARRKERKQVEALRCLVDCADMVLTVRRDVL